MTRIIAIGNLKGGVGKTTLAVHIAAALQTSRTDVLLLDADPAGAALSWWQKGLLDFDAAALPSPKPGQLDAWAKKLNAQIKPYNLAVIDLPPMKTALIAAVFLHAHCVAIPCRPSALDIAATSETLAMLQVAQNHRKGRFPRAAVIPSQVSRAQVGRVPEPMKNIAGRLGPAIPQMPNFLNAAGTGNVVGSGLAASQISRLADMLRRSAKRR